jgi:hypothetical protein
MESSAPAITLGANGAVFVAGEFSSESDPNWEGEAFFRAAERGERGGGVRARSAGRGGGLAARDVGGVGRGDGRGRGHRVYASRGGVRREVFGGGGPDVGARRGHRRVGVSFRGRQRPVAGVRVGDVGRGAGWAWTSCRDRGRC